MLLKLRGWVMIARRLFHVIRDLTATREKKSDQGGDGRQKSDEKRGGNHSMDQSPPRGFSYVVRPPALPAWSKAPGCPFSLLQSGVQSCHCHKPACLASV